MEGLQLYLYWAGDLVNKVYYMLCTGDDHVTLTLSFVVKTE